MKRASWFELRSAALVVMGLVSLPWTRASWAQTPAPPKHTDWCYEGVQFVQSGDTARAETVLLAAIAEDPSNACALTNLGNMARLRGEPKTARVFYQMALRADSTDVGILLNYACVLHDLGDPSADTLYRRALRDARNLDDVLHKLSLPRSALSDSLETKGASVDDLIRGTRSTSRPPDPYIRGLVRRAYTSVRQPHPTTSTTTPGGQGGSASPAGSQPTITTDGVAENENDQATDAVLASLPVYWKN